ncbi:hypothetical protein D3C72_2323040 [compost metagenome]
MPVAKTLEPPPPEPVLEDLFGSMPRQSLHLRVDLFLLHGVVIAMRAAVTAELVVEDEYLFTIKH